MGWVVSFLFIASFLLHIWSIGKPGIPAFDEVHFATYSAEYARHETHFDIHPPLGKLLYAAVLTFFPTSTYYEANFIAINTQDGGLEYKGLYRPFGTFPYVALRILASFFGALLPVLGYLLLKELTDNPYAPLLGGLFLLFENALLMETRLILLNGMFLTFGLASLLLFFGRKQNIYLAGILLGLALSIKLSAIVFVALICLSLIFPVPRNIPFKKHGSMIATTIGIALFVLMLGVVSHFLFSSPTDQISLLQKFGSPGLVALPASFNSLSPFFQNIFHLINATLLQFHAMVSNYIAGVVSHEAMSAWYTWPFMSGGFTYFNSGMDQTIFFTPLRVLFQAHSGIMSLTGNPVLWLFGIASVLLTGVFLIRKKRGVLLSNAALVLTLGWVAGILPFASIVNRVSFLYHYFPPLLFSLLLAAYWLGILLERVPPRIGKWLVGGVFLFVIAGFVLALPYTYGL